MLEYFVFKLIIGGLKRFNTFLNPKSTLVLQGHSKLHVIHKRLTAAHYANRMTHIHAMCGGKKNQESLLIRMVHIVTIRS